MNQIYIDTSCIIYLLEAVGPFHEAVLERLSRYRAVEAMPCTWPPRSSWAQTWC